MDAQRRDPATHDDDRAASHRRPDQPQHAPGHHEGLVRQGCSRTGFHEPLGDDARVHHHLDCDCNKS